MTADHYTPDHYTPDVVSDCDTLADHIKELVRGETGVTPTEGHTTLIETVIRRLLSEHRLGAAEQIDRMDGRDALAKVLALVIESANPRLMARVADLVCQTGYGLGESLTGIADREQVTKSLASSYAVAVRDSVLKGRNVPWLKSTEARQAYAQRQQGRTIKPGAFEFQHLLP
jgi:hypothetical protein